VAERRVCRRDLWLLAGIILLGVWLRLYQLGAESLWFDEGWTALISQLEGQELRHALWTLPFPLYYLLMSFWTEVGSSEFWLRLFSALAGILSLPLLFQLARVTLGRRTAHLAALLLAISPLHIWYSQEARMYALAVLLGLGASWAFWQAIQRPRLWRWAIYVIVSAAALHTFYYALLLLLCHGLYLGYLLICDHVVARADGSTRRDAVKRLREWLLAQVSITLLFLPGARLLIIQLMQGTWDWVAGKYGRPSVYALVDTLRAFSLGDQWPDLMWLQWGGFALFVVMLLAGIGRWRWRREAIAYTVRFDPPRVFLLAYLCVPVLAIWAFSQWKPGYLLRYLLLFLPPYLTLVAHGLATLRPRAIRWIALTLLLLVTALPLAYSYVTPQKEAWRDVAQQITQQAQEGDVICVIDEDAQAVFRYYYRGTRPVVGMSGGLRDVGEIAARAASLASEHRRVWLVTSHTTNDAFQEYLRQSAAYRLEGSWTYRGVQLALFRIIGYNIALDRDTQASCCPLAELVGRGAF